MLTLWIFRKPNKKKTREEFKEILKDNYILSIVMFVVMWQRFDHFWECLQIFVEGSLELKTVVILLIHLNPSPAIVEWEEPEICSL